MTDKTAAAMTEADKVREHEDSMARIKSRADAFARSPFWFTFWDVTITFLRVGGQVAALMLLAQCSCDGCVWRPL